MEVIQCVLTAKSMNLGNASLESKFRAALGLVCEHVPERPDKPKSLLMHVLRVGMQLYERNYSENVVIGALLHDILEWTAVSEKVIEETFGSDILEIVKVNTKDRSIKDPAERREEYIDRCIQVGKEALIVKAADVLDSYRLYQAIGHDEEKERSISIAQTILERMPSDFEDPIFDMLKQLE